MTTLLLTEIFPPKHGGSGRWFWEIYSRLPRESFSILAGTDPNQDAFDATHDLRLTRAWLAMPAWGLRSFRALRDYARLVRHVRREMKRQGATHLHVGRCLPEGWVAWLLKQLSGVSYTCFVHGEDVETAASSRELSFMVRRILSSADRLIANSQNTARLIREGWNVPSERITVLYPGCDTTRFVPAPRDALVRQQLGWNNRPTLLTVGRLQKRKGHDVLIQSLPFLREAVPDILYAVIGDGEERPALERLTRDLQLTDHVQFLGEVDDRTMIRAYQQCDLFTLPNRQVGRDIEGFGMVLVEAQACGRPVVAGASGGTRETMLPGETGEVVACESPETLAPVLTSLLLNPLRLETMGRAAREHVTARFDWKSLADEAAEVFAGGSSSQVRSNGKPLTAEKQPLAG
ncbi:MAG: glycosyltransferase family 4 protein [Planctomycetaceae bacterium]|nr:glycosyltransferase family 4 protein [Planctomycetaceae bacterium]